MVKAFQTHITAIKQTFEALSKGKFLLFFLPGAIIGLGYLYVWYQGQTYRAIADSSDSIWLVGGAVSGLLHFFGNLFSFLIDQLYIFLVLVCLSPFNCILSEKFDNSLTGNTFHGGILRIINDVLRAIFIVILAILMEYIALGVWFVLSILLPFSDILDPIMYFLIPAFFIGFSFYDYSLERYGKGVFPSWGFSFGKMSYMLISGAVFTLLYNIPAVGIIIAPVLLTMISTSVYIQIKGTTPQKEELLDA